MRYCCAVLGLLLGVQSGRQVELFNSFEMVPEVTEAGGIQFELDFLRDKLVRDILSQSLARSP